MLIHDRKSSAANTKSAMMKMIIVLFLSTGSFICKLFYTLFMDFETKVLYARMPSVYNIDVEFERSDLCHVMSLL